MDDLSSVGGYSTIDPCPYLPLTLDPTYLPLTLDCFVCLYVCFLSLGLGFFIQGVGRWFCTWSGNEAGMAMQ